MLTIFVTFFSVGSYRYNLSMLKYILKSITKIISLEINKMPLKSIPKLHKSQVIGGTK